METYILLGEEYTYRYGRKHKSVEFIKTLTAPTYLIDKGLTPFARAYSSIYDKPSIVDGYRNYFIETNQELKQYTKRPIPEWWK